MKFRHGEHGGEAILNPCLLGDYPANSFSNPAQQAS